MAEKKRKEASKKTADRIAEVTLRFFGIVLEVTLFSSQQYQNRPKNDPPSTYKLPPGVYC